MSQRTSLCWQSFWKKSDAPFRINPSGVYSGYLFDKDMVPGGRVYTPFTDRMLSCIDVLVDGEFIQELKNLSLQFRGSSNQRILHLKDGKLIKEGL